jgi:hypothetical protein
MSNISDSTTESIMRQMERMMEEHSRGMVRIPENCFAIIRMPVSIPDFAAFARVCERVSPKCVTTQSGPFMLILHAEKKEDA